jgi:polyisoprenoid-binding protein YceI
MKSLLSILALSTALLTTNALAEDRYEIDTAHASIGFSISHLVISKVSGNFTEFSGSFALDDKNQLKQATTSIKTTSIDTGIEKRDVHLRGPDFFDVEKFPEISFDAKKVINRDGKNLLLGKFTMHGVTRNIELPFKVNGPIKDPWGNIKIGFEAETVINRKDFGLGWNKALESGGVVVGEEVEIVISVEATKI